MSLSLLEGKKSFEIKLRQGCQPYGIQPQLKAPSEKFEKRVNLKTHQIFPSKGGVFKIIKFEEHLRKALRIGVDCRTNVP